MILGFSTGVLHKTHNRLAPSTFEIYRKVGCNAIELMFHDVSNLEDFLKVSKNDLDSFEYISVHTPAYRGNHHLNEYRKALEAISKKHEEIGFKSVVVHPCDIENFDLLKEFDLPFAFENEDAAKTRFKRIEDFRGLFKEFSEAKFVLDLNHIYVNDNTMKLANEFVKEFGGRLVEIHLSGCAIQHDPLFVTKQREILEAIPDKNLPIIIESMGNHPEYIEKEYNYIKEYLSQSVECKK